MVRIHCELGGSFILSAIAEHLYRTFNANTLRALLLSQSEHSIAAARAICERECDRVEHARGVTRYSVNGSTVAFYGACAKVES